MSSHRIRVIASIPLMMAPVMAAAAQSTVTVSPFVSYMPSAATNPLGGFALTFGGTTGLALRGGAEMSLSNPDTAAAPGGYRPWGADADLMLFLGGLGSGATVFSRSLAPYAFAGIGLSGRDSAGRNVVSDGWSYGVGASIPLGTHADIFGEARWRLSQYVLPTSKGAPDSKSSMRFGLSFHVGGGPIGAAPRGRRHHAGGQDDVEYVATPTAAAPPQVVVVQPAAPASPDVVVVEQEAAPPQETIIVERERPETVIVERDRTIDASASTRAPVLRRPPARVTPRRTVVVPSETRTSTRVQARTSTRAPVRVATGSSGARRTTSNAPQSARSAKSRSAPASPRAQARAQAKARATAARVRRTSTERSEQDPRE